uniref:MORN repeat protein n=1 Tax=viral metagenome TaxID=1070528 RepID=A0A6C0EA38_9ZZZZ
MTGKMEVIKSKTTDSIFYSSDEKHISSSDDNTDVASDISDEDKLSRNYISKNLTNGAYLKTINTYEKNIPKYEILYDKNKKSLRVMFHWDYDGYLISFGTINEIGYDGVVTYYKNGNIETECTYKNNVLDGIFKIYDNGELISEYNYKNGLLDGSFKLLKNGKPTHTGTYKNGGLTSIRKI